MNIKYIIPGRCLLISIPILILMSAILLAERPMVTDDPGVSPKRVTTLEIGNHFEIFRRSAGPRRYINWLDATIVYGIAENYEISVHFPLGVVIYDSGVMDRNKFGSGGVSAAMKRVWRTHDDLGGFGLEGRISFPVEPTPILGSDKTELGFNSMAETSIQNFLLRTSLGVTAPYDKLNDGFSTVGLAIRSNIHQERFGFIELFSDIPLTSSEDNIPVNLNIGGASIIRDVIIDLGITVGLTRNPAYPAVMIIAGITLEI